MSGRQAKDQKRWQGWFSSRCADQEGRRREGVRNSEYSKVLVLVVDDEDEDEDEHGNNRW